MKRHLNIAFFTALLLLSVEVFPQEEKNVIHVESGDDLGNVTDEFQENFFEALKEKAIENHEKAIAALLKCLRIDKKTVVYLELGKNHNALEEFSEAISYLEQARKAAPENEVILAELYEAYFLDKQFEEALPVVEELVAVNPTFSEDLANLYVINEKYDEALQLLDDLDEQWGNSSYRNGLRIQIYGRTGDVQGHIADLEKRIVEDPKNERNYLNLIFVYSEEGNTEKAFEVARQLQEMNPGSELVHLALYKFYLTDESADSAVKSMKVIFNSEEIDQETKFKVLNDFLEYVSEKPELEPELREVVTLFSQEEGNTEIYGQLGNFYLERGRNKEALKYYEMALSEDISNFDVLEKTLDLQLKLKNSQAAANLSENGLEAFPSQPLLYLFNGTALNQLRKFPEAEEILITGLDYLIEEPEMEAKFYRELVITQRGLQNTKKAADFEKKAAQLEKQNIHE
ncbi:tetratricopeptide repeat protein [Salinimicrobium sp. GXAS 041]|uniref:tetratricopeptide repeat protein n=1 Tax=Salinimicrobium sp. GXAS 041 TaxID=3400806 RepID=UPI003C776BD9